MLHYVLTSGSKPSLLRVKLFLVFTENEKKGIALANWNSL